jgi:hypothetical protein
MRRLQLLLLAEAGSGVLQEDDGKHNFLHIIHIIPQEYFFYSTRIFFLRSSPLLPFDTLIDVFAFLWWRVKVENPEDISSSRRYVFEGPLLSVTEASRMAYKAALKSRTLCELFINHF